jgi:hypothetical protein
MEVYISVPKVVSIFEERQAQLEKPFEMTSIDIRRSVGGKTDHLNITSARWWMK